MVLLITGLVLSSPVFAIDIPGQAEESQDGFEQAKPEIEQQLAQEKQNEVILDHITDLRDEADVEIFLDNAGSDDESAVVAKVNETEIRNSEYIINEQRQLQQYARMGVDVESEETEKLLEEIRPRIVDNLIGVKLVEQQAEAEGIEAAKEQIDQQYKSLAGQYGGEAALEEQLAAEGLSKDKLRKDIANQIEVSMYLQQFLSENLKSGDLSFSEEELRKRYEEQKKREQQMQQQY